MDGAMKLKRARNAGGGGGGGGVKAATAAPQNDKRKYDVIMAWLKEIGLGDYAIMFENHGVDEKKLSSLTRHDLKEMGITMAGPIRKILNAIQNPDYGEVMQPESEYKMIKQWLKSMGLGDYAKIFKIHQVDLAVLPSLTSTDLKYMGVTAADDLEKMYQAILDIPNLIPFYQKIKLF